MLEMILFGIGIMYTPGPVNTMGLSLGLRKKLKESLGFFFGVSVGMFLLLIVLGYTGERFIKTEYLIYISFIGCAYIIYLAYKIFKSEVNIDEVSNNEKVVSFRDGVMMQVFNPKSLVVALPITTIGFPSNNIYGGKIFVMSLVFMGLVFGAPTLYCTLGQFMGRFIKSKNIFNLVNKFMAILLLYVAFTIFRDHVYLVLTGVNAY